MRKLLKTDLKQKNLCLIFKPSQTHKPVGELEKIYKASLTHPDIVGLSIGTRPDCIDNDKLKLISSFTQDYYTWIEYGLQSVHDKTLLKINRGHDYKCFLKAYEKTKEAGINICLHIILNLFETYDEMMQTAKTIAKLEPEGVKIHMLCALEGTKITTTIHRLAGNGLRTELVAPRWIGKKLDCLNKIDREFERRNSGQGAKFEL